jgi:hypothetical protein
VTRAGTAFVMDAAAEEQTVTRLVDELHQAWRFRTVFLDFLQDEGIEEKFSAYLRRAQ